MSGFSDNSSVITTSCSEKLSETCKDYLEQVTSIWTVIYGQNDANLEIRLETLKKNLEEFWKVQIEELQNSKRSLIGSIESLGKQALSLEKSLGLESKLGNIEDIPLADLEDKLWKLLESYNVLKEERLKQFSELKEKEKNLCSVLEENCQLENIARATEEFALKATATATSPHQKVPTNDHMEAASERIFYLESLLDTLKSDFISAKEELCQLLDECEVLPLNKAERFATSQVNETEFACTKSNYHKLVGQVQKYNSIKAEALLKSDQLREQITNLWKKMLKDERELEEFLDLHKGFKKSTIMKLTQKLNELTTERKDNLKELILRQRTLLDELWTECKYTDGQRNDFQAYHSNCFTEAVLEEHEQEVERLKLHLDKHKRIYQFAGKYFELWKRLLHLEELAKQSDRLFTNRGGQLLKEEKERKTVQKKLPAIKGDLVQLLLQHREQEGDDFLYLGVPLLDTLNEMEEERQASKENEKMQRRVANVENIQLENRLGVAAGCKRKLVTPQQSNVSTKLIKMSATSSSTNSLASSKSSQGRQKVTRNEAASQRKRQHSPVDCGFVIPRTPKTPKTPSAATPANGSPSYESFQEHIGLVCKEECLSSTIDSTAKCPLPLTTVNQNGKTKTPSQQRTPYQVSKTPYKTPTKIPFRIATGSRIPSVVPPISPRSASKSTKRTRLPIIF